MSDFLLDTNALLFLGLKSSGIASHHLTTLSRGARYISHICAVEIAIKQNLGKLNLPPPFQTNFAHAFVELARTLGAEILPIELKHIDTLSHLPLHHRDPFDRLIISQALSEDLVVVTRDATFARYPGLEVLEI